MNFCLKIKAKARPWRIRHPFLISWVLIGIFQWPVFSPVFASENEVLLKIARSSELRSQINFWINVYTRWSRNEGVIHDAKYPELVYSVVPIRGLSSYQRKVRIQKRLDYWKHVLLSLHQKESDSTSSRSLSKDEKKLKQMFQSIEEPLKYLSASQKRRMRFQRGYREGFEGALKVSSRYLPAMEEIFRKENVPDLLTRIPFVESSFNINARSKVGASGVWQFIPSTARLFLEISQGLDERNDPILAAKGAAKLLKKNYESLGNWGLAVTAYNHGRMGMMRAVRILGTNQPSVVMERYRSSTFGFASSNFLAEILAAIEVEQNASRFFPDLDRLRPLKFREVLVEKPVYFTRLAKKWSVSKRTLKQLNPALERPVFLNRIPVPKGYRLRLPKR